MLILGIESSCDDTSVCLLNASDTGHTIVALTTASQIDIHKQYGGVVPEVAGRLHAEAIIPLIENVLGEKKPDVIAVTAGPGLITSLLVGVEAARTLSYAWNIPLVAVNHLDGHVHSVELATAPEKSKSLITYPALSLIVSGGHTELVLATEPGHYQLLGATKDDAAGECFDKVAKMLGLPYPGGPQISRLAASGNPAAIDFPRPMIKEDNYNFSFAGLKTSALYYLQKNPTVNHNDFCASLEQAIIDSLVTKTLRAVDEFKPASVSLVGGVAANKKLRETLGLENKKIAPGCSYLIPTIQFAMDNGAMIAVAGYYEAKKKNFTNWADLDADPNWEI